MLETLISSRTRIKLLMRLFLNPGSSAHLRGLAEEFDESTNSVRVELNRFEEAGMITSLTQGNKKLYRANNTHPLFKDLNNIVLKYIGIDRIIDLVIQRMGEVNKVYLTGDYAQGRDSGLIDLIFIGDVNKQYLMQLVEKAEGLIAKKIRFITYSVSEWEGKEAHEVPSSKELLLWSDNDSHLMLKD